MQVIAAGAPDYSCGGQGEDNRGKDVARCLVGSV